MSKKKSGFGKFALGAAIGAGLGLLFAPQSGSKTRKQLKEKMDELLNKAKEVDLNEVRDTIEVKVEEIKLELSNLDKEKVLKIAKEKGKEIQVKADELVKYAKEKATPVLEEAAEAVRETAVVAIKEVLNKLEKKEA